MGTFFQPITLIGPTGARQTVRALVDTGATFTTIPANVLEALGVPRHRTVRMRLADGRTVERSLGWITAELDGLQEQVPCVFGDPQDVASIGAVTLEIFLLAVDPAGQRLVPTEAFWA